MKAYYQSLLMIDAAKIDVPKGIRQGLLIFMALFIFYIFGDLQSGLLVSMGTLAHIYLFGGPLAAKIRTSLLVSATLALAMIMGSLTGHHALLYAILLIGFSVIPFYVFTALGVKGPSSTFFIVAFGLASYMPFHPEAALWRGALVMLGGLLCVILVYLEALLFKNRTQQQAVIDDFRTLIRLSTAFDDSEAFKKQSHLALQTFTASTGTLKSADVGLKFNQSHYERRLLLHEMAQVIFAELLELHARGHQHLPKSFIEMLHYISSNIEGQKQAPWHAAVDADERYESLFAALFRTEEFLNAPPEQVSYKMRSRGTSYFKRLIENLTPESMVFVMTIKYAVIMTTAITIALLFHIERPYWVALSTHTVMLGIHTVSSMQRAGARVIGTLIGLAIMLLVIPLEPSPLVILIVIALTGGITEMIVASNYSLAMIFITIQVLLMSSVAAGHLSQSFAYLRITDVMLGVVIAVIGTLILGRVTASSRLPGMLAALVRQEAVAFHDLFTMTDDAYLKERSFPLNQQIFNSRLTYTQASGELSADQNKIAAYYPVITLLEQISFTLNRLKEEPLEPLDQEILSDYMLAFSHIAKQIEYQQSLDIIELPSLPQADYLRGMLDELQEYCMRY
ncbi:FUSC family protein [Macrococcus hajekii]|uniref:FUSC family protein n=1 Tax=Macrococcus hajekii TaxID=198482 RepID=A0A4R6BJS9_9STAP|nr:FUSC family protein [Macrococcus hajekii]TDM01938.1 FUSC family protein [Macrococcus hajekii]GGB08700.1 FUSC family protein [Macrococcus hajekii]